MSNRNAGLPLTQEQVIAKQEEYVKQWQEATKKHLEELGDGFTAKEFTFTSQEKRRMSQQETMRVFAIQAMNDILNLTCLTRVGIEPSDEKKILYDLVVGRFMVFEPKEEKKEETTTAESAEPKP